jgi:hypothetical protein
MQRADGRLIFSPSDLNHFLECEHLIQLERRRDPPAPRAPRDPHAELLARKGVEHERAWLDRFGADGNFFMEGTGQGQVAEGGDSTLEFERWRRTGDPAILQAITDYNEEDCLSTPKLRDWLLDRKADAERLSGVISRAKALAVVICSPQLLHVPCTKVSQMTLVNPLCRFAEWAAAQGSLAHHG